MAALERVVLFTEVLYRGRGPVNRWVHDVSLEMSVQAKAAAPKRSGKMARSIRASVRHPGPKQVSGTIGASAPYTMFVLRGTHGPIMRDSLWARGGMVTYETVASHYGGLWRRIAPGNVMPVGQSQLETGAMPMTGRIIHKAIVSGQRRQDFLANAYRAVKRRHRSLPAYPLRY